MSVYSNICCKGWSIVKVVGLKGLDNRRVDTFQKLFESMKP